MLTFRARVLISNVLLLLVGIAAFVCLVFAILWYCEPTISAKRIDYIGTFSGIGSGFVIISVFLTYMRYDIIKERNESEGMM